MKKSHDFQVFQLIDDKQPSAPISGNAVLLHAFRNMTVQSFSFPFSGISRVKEALKIKFRPLLGDASQNISLIPFFVKNEKKSSDGCVFLLFSSDEKTLDDRIATQPENSIVWPVPLAFAGEVAGNGLVIYDDGESIATMWLDNWVPKYYSAVAADENAVEQEKKRALDYISSMNSEVGSVLTVRRDELNEEYLRAQGLKTLQGSPSYATLDLSNRGADLLEMREHFSAALFKFGRAAIVVGLFLLLIASGIYYLQSSMLAASQLNSETIYNSAFGERSRQPLSSAYAKVRSLSSSESVDTSLHSILRSMTAVWGKLSVSDDIIIENLRYGTENTDIMGTSENNESIQRLRQLIEEEGYSPKVENIQRIPSGALRFNMSISRGEKQ